MRQLGVYCNDEFVGVLTEAVPGKRYKFEYDSAWLAVGRAPVSVTLPMKGEAFESNELFPFFLNMLPEGANRKMVCRANHIDEEDYFGILMAMADKDCIGAVNMRRMTFLSSGGNMSIINTFGI